MLIIQTNNINCTLSITSQLVNVRIEIPIIPIDIPTVVGQSHRLLICQRLSIIFLTIKR